MPMVIESTRDQREAQRDLACIIGAMNLGLALLHGEDVVESIESDDRRFNGSLLLTFRIHGPLPRFDLRSWEQIPTDVKSLFDLEIAIAFRLPKALRSLPMELSR